MPAYHKETNLGGGEGHKIAAESLNYVFLDIRCCLHNMVSRIEKTKLNQKSPFRSNMFHDQLFINVQCSWWRGWPGWVWVSDSVRVPLSPPALQHRWFEPLLLRRSTLRSDLHGMRIRVHMFDIKLFLYVNLCHFGSISAHIADILTNNFLHTYVELNYLLSIKGKIQLFLSCVQLRQSRLLNFVVFIA